MSYELTDDEAVLLDGRVNEKAQQAIDAAKRRIALRAIYSDLTEKERAFISAVVDEAREKKLLRARHDGMVACPVCEKRGGYAKHKRSGRFHRKGDADCRKPIKLSGYSFADDFIVISGYPRLSACRDCVTKLVPYLKSALADVETQLPEMLGPSRFIRAEIHECSKCGWRGDETRMRRLPAIMQGHYPGGCPNCDAQNTAFGPTLVKGLRQYVALPAPAKTEALP